MPEARWIEWTQAGLLPREGAELLADLTSEQQARLLEHDYGARFTHGAHFGTARGEFYIDSEGSARELTRAEATEGKHDS